MALKDTLLAASIGATMVAGTHADTPQSVASSTKPAQTRSMSKAELQEINFKKKYQYLYKNVDGAWFSFGDEKKMRQALYNIGSFPMGREIIAGLPENMEFGSSNFLSNGYAGWFSYSDNSVEMNADWVDKRWFDKRGTIMDLQDTLFHELLHAYQKKQGISLTDAYPSVDEFLHAEKLTEAEAAAWNNVLNITAAVSDTGSYFLRPEEIRDLMRRDLVAEERKQWKESGMEKDFDAHQEAYFKETDAKYLMQQALISCRGNCDLAQKKMVGQEIKLMMNEAGTDWSKFYNEQALCNMVTLCADKKISEKGNPIAYQKMLDYYKKNYGLNPQDISNKQLTTENANRIAQIKANLNKYGLYAHSGYPHSSNIAYRRGESR